jgi:shikimate kinase
VLSLGGGAVMTPAVQELLIDAPVVWLDVDLVNALHRTGFNSARPMLQVNPRATMRKLMEERAPVYAAVAKWRIDTSNSSPSTSVEKILEVLNAN